MGGKEKNWTFLNTTGIFFPQRSRIAGWVFFLFFRYLIWSIRDHPFWVWAAQYNRFYHAEERKGSGTKESGVEAGLMSDFKRSRGSCSTFGLEKAWFFGEVVGLCRSCWALFSFKDPPSLSFCFFLSHTLTHSFLFLSFLLSGCGGLQHILRRGVFGPGRRTVLALYISSWQRGASGRRKTRFGGNISNDSAVILPSHLACMLHLSFRICCCSPYLTVILLPQMSSPNISLLSPSTLIEWEWLLMSDGFHQRSTLCPTSFQVFVIDSHSTRKRRIVQVRR